MSQPITPAVLSRDLSVNQRRIRAYLRANYGKLPAPETRWFLDEAKAADVRAHFRSQETAGN